jgi:glycosyltransferase involved in cell wall biosynthesis
MSKLESLIGDAVLFDMTDLLNHPTRTGIQRVTHQLALYWPKDRPIIPFRLVDQRRIALLDPAILLHVERHFSAGNDLIQRAGRGASRHENHKSDGYHRMLALSRSPQYEIDSITAAKAARAVLSLELSLNTAFYDRLANACPEKVYILNYDYILWLNPEFNSEIDWNEHHNISYYIAMLQKFPHQSFISTATRNNYIEYISRNPSKNFPVIIPGTDGLGKKRRDHVGQRAEFVIIGTVEPRKQHLPVMRAIEAVQAEGLDVSLTIIGKMGWLAPNDKEAFLQMVHDNSGIEWIEAPADDQLITILSRARASIFFSRTEGFGGPPVESLSLGVPIIVSDTTPSILDLPERGQIRLDPDDLEGLRAAIRFYTDPANAQCKQDEIADLDLPTWRSFIVGISDWIDESAGTVERALPISLRLKALELGELIRGGAPIERFLPDLFRVVLHREASMAELETWLDYARRKQIDASSILLTFLDTAAVEAPNSFSLLSLLLAGGEELMHVPLPPSYSVDVAGAPDLAAALLMLPTGHRFAERVYRDINLREGSPEEIDAFAGALEHGQSRTDLILAAFGGGEFKDKNPGFELHPDSAQAIAGLKPLLALVAMHGADDRDFIQALYSNILGRMPDRAGEDGYLNILANGRSRGRGRAEVFIDVLLSGEAEMHANDVDVVSGLIQLLAAQLDGDRRDRMDMAIGDISPQLADFVAIQILALSRFPPERLGSAEVEALLGRQLTVAELGRLWSGKDADMRLKLAIEFFQRAPTRQLGGEDAVARLGVSLTTAAALAALQQPNDSQFIEAAYRAILDRTADVGGRTEYLTWLKNGLNRNDIIIDLLQSQEFDNKHDNSQIGENIIAALRAEAADRATDPRMAASS